MAKNVGFSKKLSTAIWARAVNFRIRFYHCKPAVLSSPAQSKERFAKRSEFLGKKSVKICEICV